MDEKIKKKKHINFFEVYISKVLKQICENCGITFNAKQQLNSFICIFCKYISNISTELTIFGKRKTISEKEITNALKIILTGELLKNSLSEGDKSVDNFKNTLEKGSRQNKANIIFPPSIAEKFLRNFGNTKVMVTSTAPIFFAAVLEYLCYEILDLSSIYCKDDKRARITVRDMEISIRNDCELNNLFIKLNISFLGGGVIPFIHSSMLKKSTKSRVGKNHKFKSGTVAIRDIKKEQKNECLILSKSYFEKIVRNIFKEYKTEENFKIKKDVFIILQHFIEQYVVKLFYNSNFLTIHSGRVKLISSDIAMVSYLCDNSKNPYNSENKGNSLLSIYDNNLSISDEETLNDSENTIDEISITVTDEATETYDTAETDETTSI
jgi:histone H3/H4